MTLAFYIAAVAALVATVFVITSTRAVHALLNLIMSLMAVAVIFFVLGAPFVAALEVIVYAGAIMVLFVFVVMMLNLGEATESKEREWLSPKSWIGPSILAVVLVGELVYLLSTQDASTLAGVAISPADVGRRLFGTYLLGVELASMLLLAGLVGAYHLGRRAPTQGGS
ncbi:NADH-quinone oxidoreductase subunit J [bacterium]|nr:NADH-quinone oxidoreductase subunit J [bacterium]